MRRVTRWHKWGKFTKNQETRWVGIKTTDMRAYGTQKLWQKCKMGHEHTANKETHKLRVHTKLVVVEERPPHNCKALWVYNNTQKALYKCIIHSFIHSWQTWKHAASEKHKMACHTDQDKTRERKQRQRTHTDRGAHVSVRTPTQNQNWAWNKTRVPGSEKTTLQHETEHVDKRAKHILEAARSTRKQDCSGLCQKTMNKLDRSDRTQTKAVSRC